jgi:hypothetical protein
MIQATTVWTYFIQSVEGGPIKIGITSKDPEERLRKLQTGSPTQLRIVGLLPLDCEKLLHSKFSKSHSHGEWFKPSKDLVTFINEDPANHLKERLAIQARLLMDQSTVLISQVGTQEVPVSRFDRIFPNGNNLYDDLLGYCEWDEGREKGEDLVYDHLNSMVYICEQAGSFIESVGVNKDAGTVGFICKVCNSKRRLQWLMDLGQISQLIDCITDEWFFFAVFWDKGQQIGINLLQLNLTGVEDNRHIFDPASLGMEV